MPLLVIGGLKCSNLDCRNNIFNLILVTCLRNYAECVTSAHTKFKTKERICMIHCIQGNNKNIQSRYSKDLIRKYSKHEVAMFYLVI